MTQARQELLTFFERQSQPLPLFTAGQVREIERAAYESGLNADQSDCETWAMAGFLGGILFSAAVVFFMSL